MPRREIDGLKVRSIREMRKLTQAQLGEDLMEKHKLKKLSPRTIQRIEKEERYLCSTTTIKNLAMALDVKFDDLIPATASEEILFAANLIDVEKKKEGLTVPSESNQS